MPISCYRVTRMGFRVPNDLSSRKQVFRIGCVCLKLSISYFTDRKAARHVVHAPDLSEGTKSDGTAFAKRVSSLALRRLAHVTGGDQTQHVDQSSLCSLSVCYLLP